MKNIALAIQMYLADNNDTLWPKEHRQEVIDFFNTVPGGGEFQDLIDAGQNCPIARRGNPYLRPVVMLDEYVKNRDVWSCPSAKMESGPYAIIPGPDWFGHVFNNADMIDNGVCLKDNVFPPGWGGIVTDSFTQIGVALGVGFWDEAWETSSKEEYKSFRQSIGLNCHDTGPSLLELKLAAVQDPVRFVACSDSGSWSEVLGPGIIAYPDLCCAECANCARTWFPTDCADGLEAGGCGSVLDCYAQWHVSPAMLKDQSKLAKGSRHLENLLSYGNSAS